MPRLVLPSNSVAHTQTSALNSAAYKEPVRQPFSLNIEKQQFSRHIHLLAKVIEGGKYSHGTAAGTLLTLWSKTKAVGLPCTELPFSKKFGATNEAQSFVKWLCQQNFLNAAYWLSSAYSIWAGKEYRKQLAMFFTPPLLTQRVLDDLEQAGVSFEYNSFFDPACGGAAFLAPIALRMKAALKAKGHSPKEILRHIESHLLGTDLDIVLCKMSNHFLRMAVAEEIVKTQYEPTFLISNANSLTAISTRYKSIDVVVCNPPYRKIASDEVALYRQEYASVITDQPNLYGLFMKLGLQLLKPTGVAIFVTPTSFLSGRYFSKLRTHIMENAEISNIGIVSDRSGVFIGVEQETAITLLKCRAPQHAAETTADVTVVSREGEFKPVGRCVIPNSGSAWPIPRACEDVELIKLMGKSSYRLSDYGYVLRAGAFVWNRDTRPVYYTKTEAKTKKAVAAFPLLWSSDIRQDGSVCFDARKKVRHEPILVDAMSKKNASIVRRPSVLLQRVTSNDQPLRLVAGVVPEEVFSSYGGFMGENHIVVLEACDPLPAFPPELLVSLLGSHAINRYFRCISGSTNVSIFELSQLPLPDPNRFRCAIATGLSVNDAVIQAYNEGI